MRVEFLNILLMDQRGTGLSTPFESSMVSSTENEQVVAYLSHLRADNIVRDAEDFRLAFLGREQMESLDKVLGAFVHLPIYHLHLKA